MLGIFLLLDEPRLAAFVCDLCVSVCQSRGTLKAFSEMGRRKQDCGGKYGSVAQQD